MLYEVPAPAEPLTQGDVLDDCPLFRLQVTADIDLDANPTRWHARVLVLTQACDLAQAKSTKVLVAMVQTAQFVVDQGVLKASAVRDQVRRGLVYGWYFLPAASSPIPLPESIVDLREVHTVARPVLERLCSDGKRICRLVTPYREHLAQHFAVTYMRIGLPTAYETEP
jgi:hypothetical protein